MEKVKIRGIRKWRPGHPIKYGRFMEPNARPVPLLDRDFDNMAAATATIAEKYQRIVRCVDTM